MNRVLTVALLAAALSSGAASASAATVDTATAYALIDGAQGCAYMGGETILAVYSPTSPNTALVRVGNPSPHITSVDECTS